MKPALLVVDLQQRFFNESETTRLLLESAIQYANASINLFRERSLPIICILHSDETLKPADPDFDIPDALHILPTDYRLVKTHGNAFMEPDLLIHLRSLDVDTVIIVGFCAEFCVLSTYRGAEDHGLTPVIIRGGLASSKPENIDFVESISNIISYQVLAKMLENC